MSGQVIRTGDQNPRHAVRPTGGMRIHSLSTMHRTCAKVDVTTGAKGIRKMNPSVWLENYRLACRVGGLDDDMFTI
jgi:hypothetical protein